MHDTEAFDAANATEDVYRYIKPGKTRAPFFRYIRINLPRLTKALLLLVVAVIGASAAAVALSDHPPFPGGGAVLGAIAAVAVGYALVGAVTRLRNWDFGSLIASAAALVYVGGLFGHAPYVWNGASVPLAACWNTMLFAAVAYWALNWAVNYGVLAVWPETQGFTD